MLHNSTTSKKAKLSVFSLLLLSFFAFGINKAPVQTSAWSGTQTSTAGNYYSSVGSETGSALKSKLNTITGSPKPLVSYDWSRYSAADEAEGASDSVLTLYSRKVVKKSTNGGSDNQWNREHVFPQYKVSGDALEDNHNIFADNVKTNSLRGNLKFGVVNGGTRVVDGNGNTTDNYKNSTYFYPVAAARGEVARATMYVDVRYGFAVTGNFESTALMLQWHLENPVTNREIYRNNIVHSNQKNRNPFVDHPEYACLIWGNENNATRTLCENSGGSTTDPVSVTGVSMESSDVSVAVNATTQINASVLPMNATNKGLTWSSSDTSVFSVSSSGLVKGLKVGTATLTVKTVEGNFSATRKIKVVAASEYQSIVGDFANNANNDYSALGPSAGGSNDGRDHADNINIINNGYNKDGVVFPGFGANVVKTLTSSRLYAPRGSGIALGTGNTAGWAKLELNEQYYARKVEVTFNASLEGATVTGITGSVPGTVVAGTLGTATSNPSDGTPWVVTFTGASTYIKIDTSNRLVISKIVIYYGEAGSGPVDPVDPGSSEPTDPGSSEVPPSSEGPGRGPGSSSGNTSGGGSSEPTDGGKKGCNGTIETTLATVSVLLLLVGLMAYKRRKLA